MSPELDNDISALADLAGSLAVSPERAVRSPTPTPARSAATALPGAESTTSDSYTHSCHSLPSYDTPACMYPRCQGERASPPLSKPQSASGRPTQPPRRAGKSKRPRFHVSRIATSKLMQGYMIASC
eukprot:TRINITY_DN5837_c0_g1_i1.p1 TRINITY_DN5837_c0_g1~~TRINITY_DN5837_c0_g1_i1.p1  ORF type:complete len:127 (+),score=5.04 TRINITY_DN5837_c0_g1_i1:446-826(+)